MAVQSTIPSWDFDFTKIYGEFKLPVFDVEAVMAAQRRNIEAITAANRTAIEGAQALARRQVEIMKQAAHDLQGMWTDTVKNGKANPAASQAAAIKTAFDKALANFHELSDLVTKSNGEAIDIVAKRVSEGLDEVRALVSKAA